MNMIKRTCWFTVLLIGMKIAAQPFQKIILQYNLKNVHFGNSISRNLSQKHHLNFQNMFFKIKLVFILLFIIAKNWKKRLKLRKQNLFYIQALICSNFSLYFVVLSKWINSSRFKLSICCQQLSMPINIVLSHYFKQLYVFYIMAILYFTKLPI